MAASLAFNSLDSRSSGRWGPESLTVTPDLSRVAKVARLSDCTLVLYFVQLCMCYCVCVAGGPELGCSVLTIMAANVPANPFKNLKLSSWEPLR